MKVSKHEFHSDIVVISEIYIVSMFCHCLSASDKTWNGLSFWTGVRVKMDKFERKHIPSVSLALLTSGILGLLQAIIFILGANPILNFMGLTHVSTLCQYATKKGKSHFQQKLR